MTLPPPAPASPEVRPASAGGPLLDLRNRERACKLDRFEAILGPQGSQVPAMRLEFETSTQGDVRILRCRGRIIYGAEADALRERVNALLQETPRIVFHLGGVRNMDSGGIGRVVGMVVSARRAGGDIKFCHLSPEVDHVLQITGLLAVFQVFATEQEAVQSFARGVKASA